MKIGQKLWIFFWWPIFECVSFLFPQTLLQCRSIYIFTKKHSFNLYLFNVMAILVCLLRCMNVMCVFSSIYINKEKPMDYFNFAFYSATLAIILIAFSQINSIVFAALRTRYANKYTEGLEPSIEKLKCRTYILHIIIIIIDLGNIAYFSV